MKKAVQCPSGHNPAHRRGRSKEYPVRRKISFFRGRFFNVLHHYGKVLCPCLMVFLCFLFMCGIPVRAMDKNYTNSIGMKFVLIPPGTVSYFQTIPFSVGKEERILISEVTITKPYYLGVYEVTQEQWYRIMENNPSKFLGFHNPVERVSWNDVQEFIRRLNQREGHNRYRLPTAAEWEHAARAGTTTEYFFDDNESEDKLLAKTDFNTFIRHFGGDSESGGTLGLYAWYELNSGRTTHPVGQKKPNQWGLYDIYGNVWEWVQDWCAEYPETNVKDYQGPSSGESRVYRGGSWLNEASICRSDYRYCADPDYQYSNLGFRLAFSPVSKKNKNE